MKDQPRSVLLVSFLQHLKKADRPAFIVAIIIIALQLLFTFAKIEATPFFLYGMFSEKIPATDSFGLVQILVNDKPLEEYQPSYRELLLLQTAQENYELFKQGQAIDPLKTRVEAKFPRIVQLPGYNNWSVRIYNQPGINEPFRRWFKWRCLAAAGLKTGSVSIIKTFFLLDRKSFSFTKTGYELLEQF